MKNNKPLLIAAISLILGSGSLILFTWFIYYGSSGVINTGMTGWASVFFDSILCFIFFAQHSIMVRKSFKSMLANYLPELYLDAVYSIFSGLALMAVVILWQDSGQEIVRLEGVFRLAARALFFLSVVGTVWTYACFSGFDPFGAKKLIAHTSGRQQKNIIFVIKGPFIIVRHPIYALTIIMIWVIPVITLDRLAFNLLWTSWIVFGAYLEERDLVDVFGDSYIDYQKTTPMFIPRF